jgi:tetraacyldisaccharide 4'-kinase
LILNVASRIYGATAMWRRRRYAPPSGRRRRLTRPVISVGNLTTGGSGKTPAVDYLARLLLESGERPSILTRGYARRSPADGVTVVSDGVSVLTGVDAAGDEPMMLARALTGVPVLVGADRYLSGRLAEARFGVTVHLLDDGFQHHALARDLDLLLVDAHDLDDRVIPAGRLREPLTAAALADAVLVTGAMSNQDASPAVDPASICHALDIAVGFSVRRHIKGPPPGFRGAPVLAVAGIARPERFFADLAASGWTVAGTLPFRDHHVFDAADVTRIADRVRTIGAELIVTTEKDAVRFESTDVGPLRLWPVPLTIEIEPATAFRHWLLQRLGSVRAAAVPAAHAAPLSAAGPLGQAP